MIAPEDVALAERLADAARSAIAPYFRSAGLGITDKEDASPVTLADEAAEDAMRAILVAERPDDGIEGEERPARPSRSGRTWVLDPIDGTRAFVIGRPLWGTLIGLMVDGRPELGVLDAGACGDRWIGLSDGTTRQATHNGRAAGTRRCAAPGRARVGTTSPHAFGAAGLAVLSRLREATQDVIYGGDCHNYGLLASGHLDLVLEEGLKLHDWAALVPVVEGAGGVMTDWEGQPLVPGAPGRVLASGDPDLHRAVLRLL